MTNLTWERIADISWVTCAIFIYFIIVAIKATKPSFVFIRQLFFATGLFIVLSIVWLYFYAHLTLFNCTIWLGSIFLGTLLGWVHFWATKVKAVKDQKQIRLPGSWFLMFAIFAIVFSTFYYNFDFFSFSLKLTSKTYAFPLLIIYGICAGLFIGRLIYSIKCIKKGPYTPA